MADRAEDVVVCLSFRACPRQGAHQTGPVYTDLPPWCPCRPWRREERPRLTTSRRPRDPIGDAIDALLLHRLREE